MKPVQLKSAYLQCGKIELGGILLEFEQTSCGCRLRNRFARPTNRCRGLRNLGTLFQLHDARVRDLPAKDLHAGFLLIALFEEDGFAGVGGQVPGGGQGYIPGAVRDFYPSAQKGGIPCHAKSMANEFLPGNSTMVGG